MRRKRNGNIFNRFDHEDSNLWNFERAFKLREAGVANRPPRKRIQRKFSITLEPSILNASSKNLRSRSWRQLCLPFSPFSSFLSRVFPLTRSEVSSEGKLINYESYFPIQWIDRTFGPGTCFETEFRFDFLQAPSFAPSFVPIIYCRAWERIQCRRPTGKLQVFLLWRQSSRIQSPVTIDQMGHDGF